jgi:HlyD family secretion protein
MSFFKKFSKKKRIIIFLLLAAILISVFIFGSSRKEKVFNFVEVKKGDIIQEVSVTGKVKPAEKVNLSFNRPGKITELKLEVGDEVKKGQVLAFIDNKNALDILKNAQKELEGAKLTLEKLELQKNQLERGDDVKKYYKDGITLLDSFYQKSSSYLSDIRNLFFNNDISLSQMNIDYYYDYFNSVKTDRNGLIAQNMFLEAKNAYEEAFDSYQKYKETGESNEFEVIKKGRDAIAKILDLVKFGKDPIQKIIDRLKLNLLVHDKEEIINNHFDKISSINSFFNEYLNQIIIVINNINKYFDSLDQKEKEIELQKVIISQKNEALSKAEKDLEDYYIKAPFDGVVAEKNFKEGEMVSAAITVISVVSKNDFEIEADIPEVDIAKVKIGDVAKVTFDAYGSNVEFEAKVVKIENIERLIEGIPTYKTTFYLTNSDDRVKSGFTANLDIITNKREGVIVIPYRAVILKNGESFVNILDANKKLKEVSVKLGLKGRDGNVEVLEGLSEGDKVILPF